MSSSGSGQCRKNQSRNCNFSFGGNRSMADSISATLVMLENYKANGFKSTGHLREKSPSPARRWS
jgi:hypothetical protein